MTCLGVSPIYLHYLSWFHRGRRDGGVPRARLRAGAGERCFGGLGLLGEVLARAQPLLARDGLAHEHARLSKDEHEALKSEISSTAKANTRPPRAVHVQHLHEVRKLMGKSMLGTGMVGSATEGSSKSMPLKSGRSMSRQGARAAAAAGWAAEEASGSGGREVEEAEAQLGQREPREAGTVVFTQLTKFFYQ